MRSWTQPVSLVPFGGTGCVHIRVALGFLDAAVGGMMRGIIGVAAATQVLTVPRRHGFGSDRLYKSDVHALIFFWHAEAGAKRLRQPLIGSGSFRQSKQARRRVRPRCSGFVAEVTPHAILTAVPENRATAGAGAVVVTSEGATTASATATDVTSAGRKPGRGVLRAILVRVLVVGLRSPR